MQQPPRYVVGAYLEPARFVRLTFSSAADTEPAALDDARQQLIALLDTRRAEGNSFSNPSDYLLKVDGILFGDGPLHQPVEMDLFMAQGIRPESWLHEPRFDDFRAGYEYAAGKTQALPGLTNVSAEEAYYVWKIITRGVMQYWEHEHEEHHGERIFVEDCPYCHHAEVFPGAEPVEET